MMPTTGQRVLVIEDDPAIAETLELALSELGHEVTIASGGPQGWATLESAAERPALIMLDFLLSGGDGMILCREIKAHPDFGRIVVILMSAYPGAAVRAAEAGADDFLPKPFDLDQLEAVLARHLPMIC